MTLQFSNLVLLGMPGSGKSTVGRQLARRHAAVQHGSPRGLPTGVYSGPHPPFDRFGRGPGRVRHAPAQF